MYCAPLAQPLNATHNPFSHYTFAGYSFWTNSVYRAPLVFSGLSCLVGNLVLCLSYDTQLLPLLYIARLVTGVGGLPNKSEHVTECLSCHIGLQLAMLLPFEPLLQASAV